MTRRLVCFIGYLPQINRCRVPELEKDPGLLQDNSLENFEVEAELLAQGELLELV